MLCSPTTTLSWPLQGTDGKNPNQPNEQQQQQKQTPNPTTKQPKATTRWKSSQKPPMPPTKLQPTNNQWPNGVIRDPNILSALGLPMGSQWQRRFRNHLSCLFQNKDSGKWPSQDTLVFLASSKWTFHLPSQCSALAKLKEYCLKPRCQLASFLG